MKEYSKTTPNVIGKDLTSTLFVPWTYILIALLIAVNILIIIILVKKDKPYVYYIINIALYLGLLIVYITSNRVISNMQEMLVAAKTTLAVRDITNLARLLQSVSTVFYLIRATGFDIKKFDFVRDLQSLDISEEDSEEYEVAVEFEKNEIIRNIKNKMRNANYYYKENKFVLNIIILLSISLILLLIYLNTNKYNKKYQENEFFNLDTLTIGVTESNILTKNYKNIKIVSDEDVLVAIKISVRSTKEETLQTTRTLLEVNGTQYYNIKDYKNSLIDIGNIYNNEMLTNEFKDYLLVYQIPKEDMNYNMTFKYIDNMEYKRDKTIINSFDVKLNPTNLDEQKQITKTFELSNEIDTSETKFSDYKININNYEIQNEFITTYNSCITENECYDFKEILKPSITREQGKTLIKIEGTMSYDNIIGNINDLASFIKEFGSIEYKLNGQNKIEINDFDEVKSSKDNNTDTYYIEINKEISEAEEIKLVLNLRSFKYEYILRGNLDE